MSRALRVPTLPVEDGVWRQRGPDEQITVYDRFQFGNFPWFDLVQTTDSRIGTLVKDQANLRTVWTTQSG